MLIARSDTWGPSGSPYEGGPQCDGNWNGDGSNGQGGGNNGNNGNNGQGGNGGGTVTPFDGLASTWRQPKSYLTIGLALLLVALVL
jgi:hypothetical protein